MATLIKNRDDVGSILVKVQEDLHHLKKDVARISIQGHGEYFDIQALETAIQRTETGLKKHAEEYLNAINQQVLTLPSLEEKETHSTQPAICFGGPQFDSGKYVQKKDFCPGTPNCRPQMFQPWHGAAHLSPGIQHQVSMQLKVLYDPVNPLNRDILSQNYGISLPLISKRKESLAQHQKIIKGPRVTNQFILPASHRRDPTLLPSSLSEKDRNKGILNLLERGLIPPAAQITIDPSPLKPKAATLHSIEGTPKKSFPELAGQGNVAPPPTGASKRADEKHRKSTPASEDLVPYGPSQSKLLHMAPVQPSKGSLSDFRFIIQEGKVDELASDFLAFRHFYCLSWGNILTFLECLENFLKDYAVSVAVVQGSKVAELALHMEINCKYSKEDFLSVLENKAAVQELLECPGQRYKGQNGTEMAAVKIQSTWRRYRDRNTYLKYRQQKWAAGVIAISWLLHAQLTRVKKALKESRHRHLENFRIRAKHLAANWNRIRTSRRTIIHIPSLGHSQLLRLSVHNLNIEQNLQIGRLCNLQDINIDVIYICPVHLSEDMLQYYNRLLGLQAAVRSGNPEDIDDLQERFKIITPEAINSFPTHNMCLSTLLKYSPKTIKRIQNLIKGKEAYIVGGVLHKDDFAVADILDVPILGPELDVFHLYSTKSGSKRIFASAGVPLPPGEYDIYNLQQMCESLSQLITDNLEVKRWLFKIDDEFRGRGTAYCDIAAYMNCYDWVLKDFHRYGPEKWKQKWAQEPALVKISQELPNVLTQHAQPVNRKQYPTWERFLTVFLSQGGVIEACPPSDSITNITVDVLIEPTGEAVILSCGDQIHSTSPLECWGTSVPQTSIDPEVLNVMCYKIAESCKVRGIMGYLSIDFVTFISPHSVKQQIWATDLDLRYSDQLALTQLMLFLTNGNLDCTASTFQVPLPVKETKLRRRRREVPETRPPPTSRYAIMSTQLKHTNLTMINYGVFFQICKAHGIGFDVKERQGTAFVLYESQQRYKLGMLTIGEDLQGALMTFARNLSVIHQEISAPNMQGETNFKRAIEDIEGILNITKENKQKSEKEESLNHGST
ncbi:IQ domain-containing protein H isoform X2 [Protopterus annectens]|uniref:IQ domain-containing protein H isoform X2 n=1 Tax=Protopterus annectens TaxID=7888 RepID=UPI001CFB99B5|nr:IQ domain-containing protein H isoform X2 [Protopterus annectens]